MSLDKGIKYERLQCDINREEAKLSHYHHVKQGQNVKDCQTLSHKRKKNKQTKINTQLLCHVCHINHYHPTQILILSLPTWTLLSIKELIQGDSNSNDSEKQGTYYVKFHNERIIVWSVPSKIIVKPIRPSACCFS